MDQLDIQHLDGSGELRKLPFVVILAVAKDAVLVAIECDGPTEARQMVLQAHHVGVRRLGLNEAQLGQPAGCVIDKDDERAGRCAPLEPVMW